MKTTLIIDDGVMKRLRQEAARQGKTISELVEAALRLMLKKHREDPGDLPELGGFESGGAYVDISDRDALYQAMEGR